MLILFVLGWSGTFRYPSSDPAVLSVCVDDQWKSPEWVRLFFVTAAPPLASAEVITYHHGPRRTARPLCREPVPVLWERTSASTQRDSTVGHFVAWDQKRTLHKYSNAAVKCLPRAYQVCCPTDQTKQAYALSDVVFQAVCYKHDCLICLN